MSYRDIPTKAELEAIRERVRKAAPDHRQAIANEYIEKGAPGIVFEYMHRGGWRPASQLAGDGIVGGALDEVDPGVARYRRKRRQQKRRK